MKPSWIPTLRAGFSVLMLSLALVVGGAALETARADDDDKQAEIDRLTLELAVVTAERDAVLAELEATRAYAAAVAAERDAIIAEFEFQLTAVLEHYESEIARLQAELASAIADRQDLMEAQQEAENLQDYVDALVRRVAELEAGEHVATGAQTTLHNKWQRFLDGNPTLSLSEDRFLALYNRVARRSTLVFDGIEYTADARMWTKAPWSEGISHVPVDLAEREETIDSWPQDLTLKPILQHNGVRLVKIEGKTEYEDSEGPAAGYSEEDPVAETTDAEGGPIVEDAPVPETSYLAPYRQKTFSEVLLGNSEWSSFSLSKSLNCWGEGFDSCDEGSIGEFVSLDTDAGSYGLYTGSNPTGLGSATWTGVMTGWDLIRYEAGTTRLILGDARIDIDDLSDPDVDVEFTGIQDVTRGTSRPDMVWNDLTLTNGAFNDGAEPTISGAFYGSAHQEVGGVFDRDRIAGAFGASAASASVTTPTAGAIAEVIKVSDGYTNISSREIPSSGSGHRMVVQTAPSRYANAIPYRNATNALEFQTSHTSAALPLDPLVAWQGRSITTSEQAGSLGSTDQWQVFEGSKDYTGGGTLAVTLATDADDSNTLGQPWVGYGETDRTIVLDDIPDLLPGHDWQGVRLPDDGLQGMLDGTPGTFTCEGGSWCYLEFDRQTGYYPGGGSVVFTPDSPGSAEVTLPPTTHSAAVPIANYLSFGYWLYEPDSPTVFDPVDFGVLAGGGDPFEPSRVQGLTGTATYAGDAIGMYYTNALSNSRLSGLSRPMWS